MRVIPRLAAGTLLAAGLIGGLGAQTPTPAVQPAAAGARPQPAKAKAKSTVTPKTTLASVMDAEATPPPKTIVVEAIVARVNDKIITTTDYDNALADLNASLQQQSQSGQAPSQAQIQEERRDLLSELIDNQLLVQKAHDLGLSGETGMIAQLDQMRQQNHLATMNDLRKAVEAQGESYTDFEQSIKDQVLQQEVIEQDVAPRVSRPTPAEIAKYYNAHKSAYVTPDEVRLSEILINTKGKTPAVQKRLKDLADQVQQRAASGEDFATLAKKYSDAASASSGGDIGYEKKSDLQADLAKTLFALPIDGVSPVEKVSNGYLILQVTGIHHAGQESLSEATNNITNILYQQKMRPELNRYLATLRQDAYITVRKGYVDTGANEDAATATSITNFQRVLPSDLPKPTKKSGSGGMSLSGQ